MTLMVNKQSKVAKTVLVRTFVQTGEVRSPLAAVWSLLTEVAEEGELQRPAGWKRLFSARFCQRAFHLAFMAIA